MLLFLSFNVALTLGYLNSASNNSALVPNFCPWATRKSYFYCTKQAGHP